MLDPRGDEYVYAGGIASFTTATTGTVTLRGGAAISALLINGGLLVSSGGTASFTTISNGGADFVFSSGTTRFTIVGSRGLETMETGGSASFATVESGGQQDELGGGVASYTTVDNGGFEYVYSGGFAISTTLNSGGSEIVRSFGTAADTEVNVGGMIDVQYLSDTGGGSADLTSTGLLTVSVGSHSYTQQLAGDYADEHFVLAPDLSGGTLLTANAGSGVSSGNITVSSGEFFYVSSGQTVTSTTVLSGGTEVVLSGGSAS